MLSRHDGLMIMLGRNRGHGHAVTLATAAAVAGLLAAGLTSAAAGTTPAAVVPSDTTPERIVSGWLPFWSMPNALASATTVGDIWSEASPFLYQATSATAITAHPIEGGLTAAGVRDALREEGMAVVPTVTETLAAPQMAALLHDPAKRAAHVKALVGLVVSNDYDGIDIDYEAMNFNTTGTRAQQAAQRAAVRTGFVALMREVGAALDAHDKLLTVAVGPRTSAADPNWAVFDYEGLGAAADRVRIMTYDAHWAGGPPGAIAPLPWVKRVLDYAVSAIPRERIQVGVPLYGQDWVCGNPRCTTKARGVNARSVTYQKAEALRVAERAERRWSKADAAPYFTYVDDRRRKHIVWYSDAESTTAKMTLVETYRLGGLAFWAAGYEDKAQWKPLRTYARALSRMR